MTDVRGIKRYRPRHYDPMCEIVSGFFCNALAIDGQLATDFWLGHRLMPVRNMARTLRFQEDVLMTTIQNTSSM